MSLDPGGRFDAVEPWHVDVHNDDGWPKNVSHFHRFLAVRGLPNDLNVGMRFQDGAQTLPHHGMVVDEQHGERLLSTGHQVDRQPLWYHRPV